MPYFENLYSKYNFLNNLKTFSNVVLLFLDNLSTGMPASPKCVNVIQKPLCILGLRIKKKLTF